MMNGKLTINRIAELAGVSKATVSRVLNGYPHIRPELREKVQQVINETGYQPNNIARLLASDRSSIIGLFIPSGATAVFSDPYFPALTQSVTQGAAHNNLVLALFISHNEQQGRDILKGILTSGLLDGLIITADHRDDSFVPQLRANDMPFVFIGRPDEANDVSYVDSDNISGSYLATQHLIDRGHQRIATIASNQNSAGDDRLVGYKRALADHGMVFDPRLVDYGDYSMQSGYASMMRLWAQRPDAVFIASDTMGIGALRAIRELNLRVPEDIALVGYDDLSPAIQADPPLTTVHQPIDQTGVTAVEVLMRSIAATDPLPPEKIILSSHLVIRASSGGLN